MTPERWARVEALFLRALERAPGERAALLERECGGDEALRREVERMLASHEAASDFLEAPVAVPTALVGGAEATHLAEGTTDGQRGQATRARLCEQCGDHFDASYRFCPNDGEALVEDPEALVGGTLDGLYRIEALLGRGGMGTVYRARHVLLRDVVAIKVLPGHASADPAWLRRFQREGQAARRFRHPSAVTVYDLRAAEDGTVYLVLEYAAGETLRAAMRRRGRFDPAEALAVLGPVAGCLDAAHASGVVHRDLKPENVMVGEDASGGRVVKVLDLGIAKLMEGAETATALTRAGLRLGTPAYMPPEQWGEPQRDGHDEIDGRADVYSLALIAFEMVCGRRPFLGETSGELRRQHVSEKPPLVHEIVEGVSEAFGLAVARGLAKDRADRPATAGDLLGEVGGRGLAHVARDPGPVLGSSATRVRLPAATTSFVGREREIEGVRRALSNARLTTLAGPGGIGKTRLALEVASRELATHTDGVWFVDLSALSDPTLVPKAVASALGVREDPGRPLETVLLTTLGTKHLLLVIDNCEQLVEACAVLIEGLLRECPDVRVLATSRETLNLPGECVVRVPPLEVPDPARGATEISEVESVRLFLDRVRFNDPGYTPSASGSKAIATLCARLDGVPLALELAAARVRALTVEQILARLDDRFRVLEGSARGRPSRHQTLRATIDWSYELLEEDERVLFRRLAVFAGGWTLDAAEGVVGNDERGTMNDECQNSSVHRSSFLVHRSEVLQHLERLVDKSLVIAEQRGTEARYRMLETIRHYAAEKLREAGETALVRGCHRDWFLGFAERFERERRVGDERVWLSRVEVEHDNLRAALEWSMTSSGEADTLLRLSCALGGFWTIRGYWNEARSWIDRALELSAEPASPLRAHGLYLTGNLARLEGDSARAWDLLESSLSLYRANGENLGVGRVLRTLGLLLASEGDLDGAEAVTTEGLGVSREVDDLPEVATAANQLGVFATNRGDYERAESLHEQSLEIFRRLGPSRGLAAVKHNLGELARYRLDSARAVPLLEESLALSRYFDDRHGCLHTHLALGEIACYEGALGRADELFRTALAEASELGNPHLIGQCRLGLGHVARESGDEAAARSSYREVLATCAPPPTELLAEALEAFACMAGSQGDARRALRLEGAAAEVRDDVCVVLPPFGRRILDKHLDSARAALGPEEAARAFEAGRAMTTEQAIAYAMSVAGRR